MKEEIEIDNIKTNRIIFSVPGDEGIIVLEKGKFTYRGNTIDDVHQVYEAFCEFVTRQGFISPRG